MNIEDAKKFEPFFGKWVIDRKLGEGSYGAVYRIKYADYNGKEYFSALKILSIPKDENELAEAEISCGTQQNTKMFFEEQLQKFETEIELMSQFKGKTNIVSYEDHEIVPRTREDEVGFDVFVRMELLEDLRNIQRVKPDLLNNQIEVIRIGKDICTALEICQSHNIIHRDIKPGNIMRSADGDYKLGDFGVARSLESKQSMTRIGTLSYMAPEVENGKAYGTRADIYSLGMVLYELLNGNRGPFLPAGSQKVTAVDKEKARERILRGQDVPLPSRADRRLGAVVQKACAFLPEERYQTAKEFRMALERAEKQLLGLLGEESVNQEPQVDVQVTPVSTALTGMAQNASYNAAGQQVKKRGKAGILIGAFLMCLVLAAALFVIVAGARAGWFSGEAADSREQEEDDSEDARGQEEDGSEDARGQKEDDSEDARGQKEDGSEDARGQKEDDSGNVSAEKDASNEEDASAEEGVSDRDTTEKEQTSLNKDNEKADERPNFKNDAEADKNPFAAKKEPGISAGIHKYDICLEDVTWEQAFEKSKAKNGYLAHIDSQEELEYISDIIDEFETVSGIDIVYFWLGGRRYSVDGEEGYYWSDTDGNKMGERLDGLESAYHSFWYEGEPSFGEEEYMDMFIKDGKYVWNDTPNDLIEALYGEPSGKMAYIVEYED